ncbi:MAG: tyrosine-type recombinase/integrase [Blautia sp.]|nr:tyrosine-type recombinase/integrase [Blautia sp.]
MKSNDRNENVRLARYISRFLTEYAPLNLTSSVATLNGYRATIKSYVGWLEDEKKVTPTSFKASCFEASYIEEWVKWLKQEKGNSNDTCNVRLGALRTFLEYVSKQDIDLKYLVAEASYVHRFKKKGRNISGLTREAVAILLQTPDTSTQSGRRYLLLMLLLYSLAARIDEILSLQLKDIHLDSVKPSVSLTGKGRKVRTLGLLPKVVEHLNRYISEAHGSMPDKEAYLFYTNHKGRYTKMSQTAVRNSLKKYAAQANLKCKEVPLTLHAHQFRHAKAEHMLEDGINIVQISEYLGHEDISTTKIYLEITDRIKAEAYATINTESDNSIPKKWKKTDGTLRELVGLNAKKII